jgi:hypothetical protein
MEIEAEIGTLAFPGTREQQPHRKIRIEEERGPRRMRCCQTLRSMPAKWLIEIGSGMIRVGGLLGRALGAHLRPR